MVSSSRHRGIPVLLLLLASGLTGCTLQTTAVPGPQPGAALSGRVHGGQQPVSGARVYLLAAGQTGYGQRSTSLLNSDLTDGIGGYVLTGADGSFSFDIEGLPMYRCPADLTQVYVFVKGGDSGAGKDNSHIGLMTALGNCGSLASTPFIEVNEVTTVAAAYALSGFATEATEVSSASTALSITGLQNAFLNAAQLADISTGAALATTPNGYGTVDRQQIYTLANILAACVNTDGSTNVNTGCATLLSTAKSEGTGGQQAPDTATAAIYIAHNPGVNAATLSALSTKTSPFPHASSTPNDLSVGIVFATGLKPLAERSAIAVDGQGSVWISNGNSSVTKISSLGVPASNFPILEINNLVGFQNIAIDANGGAWIVDSIGGLLYLSSSGSLLMQITGVDLPENGGVGIIPTAVVIDNAGNLWTGTFRIGSNALIEIAKPNYNQGLLYTQGLVQTTYYYVRGLAFDAAGNIWAVQPGILH